MQTFLPDKDFTQCAKMLDMQRLGKQRVEAKQILKALHYRQLLDAGWTPPIDSKTNKPKRIGWVNHTATLMWETYDLALCAYMNAMILEWKARGYKNTMPLINLDGLDVQMPYWLGCPELHSSHRSNLLGKKPEFYEQYGWTDDPSAPYIWYVGSDRPSDLRLEKLML